MALSNAEGLHWPAYLGRSARLGGWRPAGEGAVLLGQLVQARLQALHAPVQLRHAPLRQLAHLGHLARSKTLSCLRMATISLLYCVRCLGSAQPWPCLTCP